MKEMFTKEEFVGALKILQNVDEWDNKLYGAGIQLHDGCPHPYCTASYRTHSEFVRSR